MNVLVNTNNTCFICPVSITPVGGVNQRLVFLPRGSASLRESHNIKQASQQHGQFVLNAPLIPESL